MRDNAKVAIPQVTQSPERLKRPSIGGGKSPRSGERQGVAKNFEVAIERVESDAQDNACRLRAGVDPHLVFRMPLFPGANVSDLEEKLESVGLGVVSIEPDKSLVVVFRADADLAAFREAIETYKAPKPGSKSTVFDVLKWVKADEMRALNPQDRIGPQLAEEIGAEGERLSSRLNGLGLTWPCFSIHENHDFR